MFALYEDTIREKLMRAKLFYYRIVPALHAIKHISNGAYVFVKIRNAAVQLASFLEGCVL